MMRYLVLFLLVSGCVPIQHTATTMTEQMLTCRDMCDGRVSKFAPRTGECTCRSPISEEVK